MGFPDPDQDAPVFTDSDLQAMRLANDRITEQLGLDRTLQELRVVSASLAKISETIVDDLANQRSALEGRIDDPRTLAREMVSRLDFDREAELFLHLFRRQLAATLRRRIGARGAMGHEQLLAIGFVDLVGFTALSQELESDELEEIVTEFEARAFEAVARLGGRVIKTIGDEVMFAVASPEPAVEIALELISDLRKGHLTPEGRAGIAWGEVLAKDGDCYGTVVNLAERLVNIARPGTVVVSDEVHEALADEPGLDWRFLRARRLKGLGRLPVWAVRKAREAGSMP
jgi:adenylate cyclase